MLPLILFGVALMQTSPYLEMPPEQLVKRIPELKTLQSAQDQQMLPAILSKSGARVSDFLNQLVDLTAHEEITQEILDESGSTKSSRQRKYSYLILLHQSDLSPTPEEYRSDAKGNRVAPGGLGPRVHRHLRLRLRMPSFPARESVKLDLPLSGHGSGRRVELLRRCLC